VSHVVTLAFFSAGIAYISASCADVVGELAAPTHESDRCAADAGAIEIEFDATRQ